MVCECIKIHIYLLDDVMVGHYASLSYKLTQQVANAANLMDSYTCALTKTFVIMHYAVGPALGSTAYAL